MNFLQVCELHFPPSKIIRTTSAFDDKCGKTITCNLKIPKLSFGAVPLIFPNCPAYLSQSSFKIIYPWSRSYSEQLFLELGCI